MDRQKEKKRMYKEIYNKEYWKENKDRYKNRIVTQLGNPKDDEVFLKYKHTIDEIENPQKRKEFIKKYKSLADNLFEFSNQADYLNRNA